MGSHFTEDGQYIAWSPLFDYFSIKTLEKSQEFPMPNGTQYSIIFREEGNNFIPENSVDITKQIDILYNSYTKMS